MSAPLCRHIKITGQKCRAVAIADGPLCYFHHKFQVTHRTYRQAVPINSTHYINLNALETFEAIQIAISQVVLAMGTGQLAHSSALMLLRGLQIAYRNLALAEKRPKPEAASVRLISTTHDCLDLALPDLTTETPEEVNLAEHIMPPH
ncbi:hypothetical protein [Granulicella arctica]|uniref:hypothetical protein n=1 Tax=Granulicella arctica TaxID=940613 RepID=UPI0021DFDCD8|nr:hypothetical protein [Granulicella arctica]